MEIHNDNSIQHCSCIRVIRGRECVPDTARSPPAARATRVTAFIRDSGPGAPESLAADEQGNVFGGFIEMQALKNTSAASFSLGPLCQLSCQPSAMERLSNAVLVPSYQCAFVS